MAISADPLTLLARAVDQAGEAVGRVPKAQASLPTPCRSWNVWTLTEHVDMAATVQLPIGDLPAAFVVNQQIAELPSIPGI
jgi:hypothetical protein